MGNWIKKNPVWFMSTLEAFIAAVMNLILAFGADLTGEQIAAINGVVMVFLTLVLGLWAQTPLQRLMDNAKLENLSEKTAARKDSRA